MYEHEHGKKMNVQAIAGMIHTMLYSRRFFPYYVSNILAGLDEQGSLSYYAFIVLFIDLYRDQVIAQWSRSPAIQAWIHDSSYFCGFG